MALQTGLLLAWTAALFFLSAGAATADQNTPIKEAKSGFQFPVTHNASGYTFAEPTAEEFRCLPNQPTWIYHQGHDLNAPTWNGNDPTNGDRDLGTPVLAAATGRVVYVNAKTAGGIVIQHLYGAEAFYTQYGHIQNPLVTLHEDVERGQQIAEVGKTRANLAHLHFEVRTSSHPEPTNGNYFQVCEPPGSPYYRVLQDLLNIQSWYVDPIAFVPNHGPYDAPPPPPPPASVIELQISTGDNQTGPAGSILPNAVSVLSIDQAGNTVGLVPVTFRVSSGGGCISASPAGTNCQSELAMITNGTSGPLPGLAGIFWKLGPLAGMQTVEVVSPGLATITFTANATVLYSQLADNSGTIYLPARDQFGIVIGTFTIGEEVVQIHGGSLEVTVRESSGFSGCSQNASLYITITTDTDASDGIDSVATANLTPPYGTDQFVKQVEWIIGQGGHTHLQPNQTYFVRIHSQCSGGQAEILSDSSGNRFYGHIRSATPTPVAPPPAVPHVYSYLQHSGLAERDAHSVTGFTCDGCPYSAGIYFRPQSNYENVSVMNLMVSKNGRPDDHVMVRIYEAIDDPNTGVPHRGALIASSSVVANQSINQEPNWNNFCASFHTANAMVTDDCFTTSFSFASPLSFVSGQKYLVLLERTGAHSPISFYWLSGRSGTGFPTDPENAAIRCDLDGDCQFVNSRPPIYTTWRAAE